MAYFIIKFLFPLLRALFVRRVVGLEHVPRSGAFILAANHSSYLDSFFLMATIGGRINRTIHFIMAPEYAHRPLSPLLRLYGVIFVNGSTEKAVAVLKRGGVMGIFPEGMRSYTGELTKVAHSGIVALSALSDAPVVPVGIRGAFEMWPRTRKLPRFKKIVEVHIGKPMHVHGPLTKTHIKKNVSKIMKRIAWLAGKKYRY